MANQPTKYRKFVVGAASAALVASAVAPVASAKDFSDTKGNTHEAAIDALSDAGIITGYEDGTFKPNKTLTRSDVVKMMGKWLVSEGYEVPEDYKTNMRFSDLTASTNDELLKYAAVVKDNGVFNGSNGRLLAGDNMSRENMAVVLVRAFDTVKEINLVEYVEGQDFKKEVTDLNSAKSEARTAINVLDFFDVTTVAQFNPKDTTTRGHFATFLNNFLNADLSKVTGVVDGVASVDAINNTTVEVKFVNAIEDIKAIDFAIEGLEVKNAVVKQTDAKTAVLTTSVHEGGKKYTVTANGKKLGDFIGVSAVIPTKVSVTTASQQGILGQEATVKAQVTVAEGQSKAGIPVTFNITGANKTLNNDIVVEAFTDENGVATYSYTRYANSTDTVLAYATGDRSKYSTGYVYWSTTKQLTVKDITEGASLTNGSSKVYEINSTNNKGGYVFVTFEENVNVEPNKAVTGAVAEGITTYSLAANGTATSQGVSFPYQYTTGATAVTAVKLDASGKANLVVTGSNAKVTPIVYQADYTVSTDNNTILTATPYTATALQAKASTVEFAQKHELGLTIEAHGVQNAATYIDEVQTGGRDYTVTYLDKDGKPAAAGSTTVWLAIPRANSNVGILDKNGFYRTADASDAANSYYALEIDSKGQAKFTVASASTTAFIAPTVFVNNGSVNAITALDPSDLQAQGEHTYFVNTVTYTAALDAVDADGYSTKSVLAGSEYAEFVYELVDQNGKPRSFNQDTNVTFQVTAGTSPVTVDGGRTIVSGNTDSVTRTIPAGQLSASIVVRSAAPSSATVRATGSRAGVVLPTTNPASVTVSFTRYSSAVVTGIAGNINRTANTVEINGVPYSYTGAAYEYNGSSITLDRFENTYLLDGVTVSVTKDEDGKLTFNILTDGVGSVGSVNQSILNTVNDAIDGVATQAAAKAALQKVSSFAALSNDDQNAVLATILGGAKFANVDALNTALKSATFSAAVNAVVTTANGASATYAGLVSAVRAVEGAADSVKALTAVTDTDVQDEILSVVSGLTASNIDTDAATFNAAIADAIATAERNVGQVPVTNALKSVNDVTSTGTATTADVVKVLEDNKTVLGYVADWNALSTADKNIAAASLNGTRFANALALRNAVADEAKASKLVAKVDEITLTNNALAIVFDENIDLLDGYTIATGDEVVLTVDGVDITIEQTASEISISGDTITLDVTGLGLATGNEVTKLVVKKADGTVVTLVTDNAYENPVTIVEGTIE